MNPEFAKKVARLIVVPCDRACKYHTFDPLTKRAHTVRDVAGSMMCDCTFAAYRQGCAHSRKVRLYIDTSAAACAAEGA